MSNLDTDLYKVDTDPSFNRNMILTDRKVKKKKKEYHNHEKEN